MVFSGVEMSPRNDVATIIADIPIDDSEVLASSAVPCITATHQFVYQWTLLCPSFGLVPLAAFLHAPALAFSFAQLQLLLM